MMREQNEKSKSVENAIKTNGGKRCSLYSNSEEPSPVVPFLVGRDTTEERKKGVKQQIASNSDREARKG